MGQISEKMDSLADAVTAFRENMDRRFGELEERQEEVERRMDRPSRIQASDDNRQRGLALEALGKWAAGLALGEKALVEEALAVRAFATTPDSAGGGTIPELIASQIMREVRASSPLLQDVRFTSGLGTVPSGYKRIVSDTGTTSGWVGEGDSRSETGTSTFNTVTFPDGILYAYPKASEEVVHGSFVNVGQFVLEEVTREFRYQLENAVISGTGTKQPFGILDETPGAPSSAADDASPGRAFQQLQYVPTGTAGALPPDYRASPPGDPAGPFLDVIYAMRPEWRMGAKWYASGATIAAIAKLRDADGRSLLQPSMAAGVPPSLLGFPLVQAEGMPAIGSNTYPVMFANLMEAYEICEAHNLRVTFDDNITTPGYAKWYVRQFVSGNKTNSRQAIKLLKAAAS